MTNYKKIATDLAIELYMELLACERGEQYGGCLHACPEEKCSLWEACFKPEVIELLVEAKVLKPKSENEEQL